MSGRRVSVSGPNPPSQETSHPLGRTHSCGWVPIRTLQNLPLEPEPVLVRAVLGEGGGVHAAALVLHQEPRHPVVGASTLLSTSLSVVRVLC